MEERKWDRGWRAGEEVLTEQSKSESLSHVGLFATPWSIQPMVYTAQGILQARMLEWATFSFSRGSSQPRDQTQVSHIAGRFFTS